MAAETRTVPVNTGGARTDMTEQWDSGLGVAASTAVRLTGPITVQLSGTATSATAMVQRSTSVDVPNWAPADDSAFSGDLTSGLSARTYEGVGAAWWRVNVTAASGGTVNVSIMGLRA